MTQTIDTQETATVPLPHPIQTEGFAQRDPYTVKFPLGVALLGAAIIQYPGRTLTTVSEAEAAAAALLAAAGEMRRRGGRIR